ncbi:hypothetical protein [Streptomyces sp. NPDC007063]|uniref:hypothetical protein n=1 Tax=Streptomyces sp. NPDC007063 TaxID=3364772 RepID=UPI003694D02A
MPPGWAAAGSFGKPLTGLGGRLVKVPNRVRKISNVVLCLTAVAGIWWGGPLLLQTWTARQQIDEGCGGLVPAVPVLALSPAGGTISHRQSDSGTIQLDADLPQQCELFSTEAGEKHDTSSGQRWFFTGAVGALPSKTPVTPEDSQDRLLDPYGDPTYPPEPLGGGIVGTVSVSGVTVELPCSDGRANGKPVEKLWARASLTEPGRPFSEKGQLFSSDRNALADIAVRTLNNLAEHAGCTDRLPDAPTDIPALTAGPEGAAHANGTCEWYRKKDFAGDEQLPDQVLESRTDNRLWDERCGLVLGEERAHRLWESVAADRRHSTVHPPSSIGEWYVSLHTYAGEGAENVQLDSIGYDEPPVEPEPGTAGRGDESMWWASSVCAGKPQIHTMTVSYGYDKVIPPERAEKLFRAYVTDVASRRGCTDTQFPASSAFHTD